MDRKDGVLMDVGAKTARISPMPGLDAQLVSRLRDDLRAADWTVDGVSRMLSDMAESAMERDQLIPAVIELEGNESPAALLTLLFVLAQPLSQEQVSDALPSLGLDGAEKLQLVSVVEGNVRADVDLRPHSAQIPEFEGRDVVRDRGYDWWIASDLSQAQTGLPPQEDYVLGIASATTNLLGLTMRQRVGAALDLGCGCGILALYLAKHADRVVATDVSERACQFTRFNALLNDVDLDVRQGSLFEPLEGESFDLITSNPPFVITPQSVRERRRFEYRDGGLERDSLIPLVAKNAVPHLNAGGALQMLANWEIQEDSEDWANRPKTWVEEAAGPALATGLNVDAWIVQRDLVDVGQYAQWWMRDALGEKVAPEVWATEYKEWLRDFKAAGITHVGLGFIALRVGVAEELKDDVLSFEESENLRGQLERKFERQFGGRLRVVSEYLPDGTAADGVAVRCALDHLELPEDWARRKMVRAGDVREVRYFVPGTEDPQIIRISQGRPGGRERTVSSAVAALIGVSDGELTAEQVIPAIAHLLGEDAHTTEMEVREAVEELLRAGVLLYQ